MNLAQLIQLIRTLITTNNQGLISAEMLRTVLESMASNVIVKGEAGNGTDAENTLYVNGNIENVKEALDSLFITVIGIVKATDIGFNSVTKDINLPTGAAYKINGVDILGTLGDSTSWAGNLDASAGTLPTTGTGAAGAIRNDDRWRITTAGTILGLTLEIGDLLFAKKNDAAVIADFYRLRPTLDISGKVNFTDIITGFATSETNKPTSQANAKELYDAIAALTTAVSYKIATSDIVNNLTSTANNKPLAAAQGKVLNDAIVALTSSISGFNAAINSLTNANDANVTQIEILKTQKIDAVTGAAENDIPLLKSNGKLKSSNVSLLTITESIANKISKTGSNLPDFVLKTPLYVQTDLAITNIAITGTHIPSLAEWQTLENYLIANGYNYDNTTSGNKIAQSLALPYVWKFSSALGAVGNASTGKHNASYFSATPRGNVDDMGNFSIDELEHVDYWLSDPETAVRLSYNSAATQIITANNAGHGKNIRLICDSNPGVPFLTDIDGNKYNVVQIGTQYWLAEDLKVTRNNNGDAIFFSGNYFDWNNESGFKAVYFNHLGSAYYKLLIQDSLGNVQLVPKPIVGSGGGGGSFDIALQTDVETANPSENTKGVTPLRGFQGFVYWLQNSTISALNTTSKFIVGAINELKTAIEYFVEVVKETGFPDRSQLSFSFINATRTFTIQPTGTEFRYYINGEKYIKTAAETFVISNVEGNHFIYYNGANLAEIVNATVEQVKSVIRSFATVYYIYWDVANQREVIEVSETHYSKDYGVENHIKDHVTQGALYGTGLGLNTINIAGTGDLAVHAQFGIDVGTIYDEDIEHAITAMLATVGCNRIYYYTAAGLPTFGTNLGYSVLTTGTGRLAYNPNGSALVEVTTGSYVWCHIFATPHRISNNRVSSFVGRSQFSSLANAYAGLNLDALSVQLGALPSPEFKLIASVLFQTSNAYANAVKARTRAANTNGDSFIDWRKSNVPNGGTVSGGGVTTPVFADNVFKIFDDGDITKELQLEVSSLPTATVSTLTVAKGGTVAILPTAAVTGNIAVFNAAKEVEDSGIAATTLQPKITITEGNIVIGGAGNTLVDSNIHYSLIGV